MKNWTLRQRILASFAVIIAIMLLMVVASYSRLLSIESSEETVRTDAIPGVYYSSMIRSAWVDSYILTQQLVGAANQRDLTNEDNKLYASYADRLNQELANYRSTIFDSDDRASFSEFEGLHKEYDQILANVVALYKDKEFEQARAMFNEQMAPAWMAGRKKLNSLIDANRESATGAINNIAHAVFTAKISMIVSLVIAVLAAVVVVYLMLGILYESFVHPITILSTLLSAALGALLALMITGTQFDIIGLIGIVLLIGIVMKNGIMMVDFAQRMPQLRANPRPQRQRHRAEQRGHAGHQDRPEP